MVVYVLTLQMTVDKVRFESLKLRGCCGWGSCVLLVCGLSGCLWAGGVIQEFKLTKN